MQGDVGRSREIDVGRTAFITRRHREMQGDVGRSREIDVGRTAFMISFWCAKEATPSCASCDICSHCSLAPLWVRVRARVRVKARVGERGGLVL